MFARQLVVRLINLIVIAVLARNLSPSEFGLVALAQVILQLLVLSQTNGVGAYVIYDRAPAWEDRSHSAFWFNFMITSFQLGFLFGVIPFISRFYTQYELPYILVVLGLTYFLQQISVVPDALVQRQLNFRPIVTRDTLINIISGILGVTMALTGWGVWSLILPNLITQPISVIASFVIAKWRPRFRFGLRDWLPIAKYTTPLMGTSILGLILNDGDTILIGKFFGSQSLGFYNIAWQLSNLVGRNVTSVIGTVAMPALSSVNGNMARLRSGYCRMLRFLGLITFPALFVFFVLADDIVQLVYGPDWGPVVNLVRIFILFTVVRSITSPSSFVYNVVGRSDIGFKFNLGFLPFYLIAIFWGSYGGIVGVAIGVTIVRTIGAIIALIISTKLINLPFAQAIGPLFSGAITSFGVAILIFGIDILFIMLNITLVIRLGLCFSIAVLLYSIGLALFTREAYQEVSDLISSMLPHPMLVKLSALKRSALFARFNKN